MAAAIASVLALTGCGTSELEVEPTFDGVWVVATLVAEGDAVALGGESDGLTLEIDTGDAAVRGRTGCGPIFGSYTLVIETAGDTSGQAGFTMPSPSPDETCDELDRARHEALVAALETVTVWRQEGPSLLLEAPPATVVELRPAG